MFAVTFHQSLSTNIETVCRVAGALVLACYSGAVFHYYHLKVAHVLPREASEQFAHLVRTVKDRHHDRVFYLISIHIHNI